MKMFRTSAAMLFIVTAVALTGCAGNLREGIPQYTDTLPTAKSVGTDGQLYKGGLIVSTDFKADGSRRQLADYDFSKETAPCAAIDSKAFQTNDHAAYALTRNGHEFIFICRSVSRAAPAEKRLFLAGTHKECLTRTDSYVRHPEEILRKAGSLCGGMIESSPMSKVEKNFSDSFKG